eukprot:4981604-Amphidinium_carterae.1
MDWLLQDESRQIQYSATDKFFARGAESQPGPGGVCRTPGHSALPRSLKYSQLLRCLAGRTCGTSRHDPSFSHWFPKCMRRVAV